MRSILYSSAYVQHDRFGKFVKMRSCFLFFVCNECSLQSDRLSAIEEILHKHSCCLVICLLIWFVLQLYFLSTFHRWDLASKSHTKSFIEEVLRWEIDLEPRHFGSKKPLQILKTNKQVIFLGRGDVPVRGAVPGKESHDEHFQLRLEVSD